MFDPDQFLGMQVTGSNDTKSIPVPVGEYTAIIEEVKVRSWTAKDDPTKSGLALDLLWEIDDQAVRDELGRDKVVCKQGIMLDLTDAGTLDMGKGKNLGLGRLREATGLNDLSSSFSFSMLPGRMGKVSVSHRVNGEDIFAEIKRVAAVS